ncbi:unnamed protein product [Adineta ricciae]|uniref:Protein kintoun n=1 Tax=Adineta ricciae TaxID=249248 RepID=A0A813W425_ADIRI|nr:unnamed protein product [Adineta ricciae]CAF0849501.1 unnamed protein product [Adineta ricciae]
MTASTFQDKLKDLNLTGDEMKRFSDAFQNAEFRKLFIQYAEELNDPKNRELYEQEIRAAEQQRGSDVTFIHPNAGHVLKTTIGDKTKCFINIAMNEHVDKPSYAKTDGSNGKKGAQWSLPHCLAGPHEDLDHESKSCTVYDVIFSPDTYRMGETNEKFMNMIDESALDSVEKNYNCKLDRKNVKRLKMKFKGIPKATILRKKQENFVEETEKQLKDKTDEIIDKALSSAQNHKVILSSHNRSTNNSSPPSASITPPETNTPRTDENGFTIPTYRIVHRGEFDMQDCTNSLVPQVHSMRPKELLVEIDLPLCASSSNVDLDVCERSLKLHCDSPKYSLDLPLSYPVRESDSHARFDKKQRKLLVVLAVIKEISTIIEMQTNTPPEETNEETAEVNSPIPTAEPAAAIEKPANVVYTSIPFEYKQGSGHLAIVIYVKNVDESSFKLDNDGQHVIIQLSSLGSGFYPLQHQLCLDFDEPMTFDTAESSSSITFNNDNVLVVLKKTSNNKQIDHFQSSVNRDDMKTHYSTVSNTPAPDKANTSSTQAMTKDDFLMSRSDSSTSLNGDQQKQLTKKQAKKIAKQKRKNSLTKTDSNDKLSNEISSISLQSNTDEEKEEDKLPEMPKSITRPTVYRRHMSESQVELGITSNGEFKLKGILKNSTKYRSYSASFSEHFDNSNNDNQHEEPVFEACSTVDDLTSSNENNSIVTSPDSGGSSSLCTTPSSSLNVKHVTFNNQVSRKTFKPGGPVSGMRKLSSHQQRKLKKRKRQDSLNSQSSDPDDSTSEKNKSANQSNEYKNPVEFQDVIARQASGIASSKSEDGNASTTKSAVQFTNPLIFELDN